MVIVHLSGGFGNQMFSYAFGYAVAKARNEELVIDTAIQDAPWFFRNPDLLKMNISYDKRISYKIGRGFIDRAFLNKIRFYHGIGWKTKIVTEDELAGHGDPIAFCKSIKGDIYLKGNWGNESWFKNVSDQIVERYSFIKPLSEPALKLYDEIKASENATTMHIRRGDYVQIGIAMEPAYYIKAMDEIAKRVENPVFYCFSEDLEWARKAFENTSHKIVYADYQSEDKGVEDFRLLSAGKHQIISNSSYSWWAAYLNQSPDKQVVIPCREDSMWNHEFMVEGWIPLSFTMNGKKEAE